MRALPIDLAGGAAAYISSAETRGSCQCLTGCLTMASFKLPNLQAIRAEREAKAGPKSFEEDQNEVRRSHVVEIPKDFHYQDFFDQFDWVAYHKTEHFRVWAKSGKLVTVTDIHLSVGMKAKDLQVVFMSKLKDVFGITIFVHVKGPEEIKSDDTPSSTPNSTPPIQRKKRAPRGSSSATKKKASKTEEEAPKEEAESAKLCEERDKCHACQRMLTTKKYIKDVHQKGCKFQMDAQCLACSVEMKVGEPQGFHSCLDRKKKTAEEDEYVPVDPSFFAGLSQAY